MFGWKLVREEYPHNFKVTVFCDGSPYYQGLPNKETKTVEVTVHARSFKGAEEAALRERLPVAWSYKVTKIERI